MSTEHVPPFPMNHIRWQKGKAVIGAVETILDASTFFDCVDVEVFGKYPYQTFSITCSFLPGEFESESSEHEDKGK